MGSHGGGTLHRYPCILFLWLHSIVAFNIYPTQQLSLRQDAKWGLCNTCVNHGIAYRPTVRPLRGGREGGVDADEEDSFLEGHELLWESRRSIARGVLLTSKAVRSLREAIAGPGTATEKGDLASDGKGAVVVSAAVVAIGVATLRFGGRAALVQVLGLDIVEDAGIREQVSSFLTYFDGLGDIRYLYFLGGWVVAKTFLLDFLSIALALSSGIIFGGVFQGALISSVCATLASIVGFQLARTKLREAMVAQVEKRPVLKALERVVSREGFKTVVTLRLAPVLPIPLGVYNFVYGTTSLPLPQFVAGTFVGSFKPYLLDSYLGVFGATVMNDLGGAGSAAQGNDLILGLAFFAVILVGTFATQVAGRTWDELSAEAKGRGGDGTLGEMGTDADDSDGGDRGWDMLDMWGIELSSLPTWFQSWQKTDQSAKDKIWGMVEQEWGYMEGMEGAVEGGGAGEEVGGESPFPPPGPPPKTADGGFDYGVYAAESTVFPFVLLEALWRYSNPAEKGETRAS